MSLWDSLYWLNKRIWEFGDLSRRIEEKDGASALRRFRLLVEGKKPFRWGLAAEAAAESIAVSAAAEEQQDNPQAAV